MRQFASSTETLRKRLKVDTQAIHNELEQTHPLVAIQHGQCCEVSNQVLRIFNGWHIQVDQILAHYLPDDLFHQFRQDDLPDHLRSNTETIESPFLDQRVCHQSYGLGWLYVILGSSMGARAVLQQISHVKHESHCQLTDYYLYMVEKQQGWKKFLTVLGDLEQENKLDADVVVTGAFDAFNALIKLCEKFQDNQ